MARVPAALLVRRRDGSLSDPAFRAAARRLCATARPELLGGVIALEPPLRSPGRPNTFLAHAAVSGGLHDSAYVRGSMDPTSPEACRRRAARISAQQGGPGVYAGDLGFYSDGVDGRVVASQIDTDRVPVHLPTGGYDDLATVEDGAALARLIPAGHSGRCLDCGISPCAKTRICFEATSYRPSTPSFDSEQE